MLSRQHRLRSAGDFRRVYQQGRSRGHPAAVLYVLRQPAPAHRIGISASRRLGGAVARNRIRRRFRALCRQLEPWIMPGVDLVFVIRPAALAMKPDELYAALENLLQRSGVWRDPVEAPAP
jgi:ribonuclease P protein component